MKSIFMRVLFCKIHCPSFICFCKPSSAAAHLYTSGPLKLDNSPHVLPLGVDPVTNDHNNTTHQLTGETIEVKDQSCLDDDKLEQASQVHALKTCFRNKEAASVPSQVENKKVQWLDNVGKQLADIKEFESSEIWDIDYDEDSRGCVCVIL
ncbi:Acetyl-coenzyme A synthetase [Heracleum sosnowskyi]|uniref:Acetyl-coenzyme A synthetase n=1 Tax=Heracleum sosnowskyi TaxID=360622 RepID=A0AAD8GWZ2_9APIA|nr:Acetyl-coenzyme A synthetase [Heracleum sosnowskyi]